MIMKMKILKFQLVYNICYNKMKNTQVKSEMYVY